MEAIKCRISAETGKIGQIGKLNVVPDSNPLGMKSFVPGISISFKGSLD